MCSAKLTDMDGGVSVHGYIMVFESDVTEKLELRYREESLRGPTPFPSWTVSASRGFEAMRERVAGLSFPLLSPLLQQCEYFRKEGALRISRV